MNGDEEHIKEMVWYRIKGVAIKSLINEGDLCG